jgi:hypothetical protein
MHYPKLGHISCLLGFTLPKALDDSHRASQGLSGVSNGVLLVKLNKCR